MRCQKKNHLVLISKLCLIVLSVVFNLKSSACGKAVFVVSSSSYCVGISDTFTNNSTGNFTKFIWKWGDGTTNTTDVTQVNHNHTFPKGGTYTVTLILDSGGVCLDSQSKVVIIQKLPNVNAGANFSIFTEH